MGAPIDSMLWKIPLGLLLVSAIIALPSALASPIASAIGSDDIVPEKGIQPVEFATKILGLEGLVTKVQKDHRASKAQPDSARDHKHEARNAVHDHKHEARNAVQSSLSSSLLELDKPDTWTCGYYERYISGYREPEFSCDDWLEHKCTSTYQKGSGNLHCPCIKSHHAFSPDTLSCASGLSCYCFTTYADPRRCVAAMCAVTGSVSYSLMKTFELVNGVYYA